MILHFLQERPGGPCFPIGPLGPVRPGEPLFPFGPALPVRPLRPRGPRMHILLFTQVRVLSKSCSCLDTSFRTNSTLIWGFGDGDFGSLLETC